MAKRHTKRQIARQYAANELRNVRRALKIGDCFTAQRALQRVSAPAPFATTAGQGTLKLLYRRLAVCYNVRAGRHPDDSGFP